MLLGGKDFYVFLIYFVTFIMTAHNGRYTMEDVAAPQGYVGSRLSVKNALMYHAGEYKCTSFSPRSHTVYVLSGKAAEWGSW